MTMLAILMSDYKTARFFWHYHIESFVYVIVLCVLHVVSL